MVGESLYDRIAATNRQKPVVARNNLDSPQACYAVGMLLVSNDSANPRISGPTLQPPESIPEVLAHGVVGGELIDGGFNPFVERDMRYALVKQMMADRAIAQEVEIG